jgi:hypothetical protein
MQDWNVVITIYDQGFREAFGLLEGMGRVSRTGFLNVLVMKVGDLGVMLETICQRWADDPRWRGNLARVMPVTKRFTFQSAEEFEAMACDAILPWMPELAGKSFHVRMHRRGFKGRLSSQAVERRLSETLLEEMEKSGEAARITFQDPDAILAVETVGSGAGLSLWCREELQRYPFLKLD